MNIEEKRKYLLKKLSEKEDLIYKYDNLMGPGLLRKMKKLILFREKYILRRLTEKGFLKIREIKAKTFWGRKMNLLLADNAALSLYSFGTLLREEFPLTRFFIKNLKENDIFYDIGANYGFYSLLGQKIIKEGEIHAFEPHPKIFSFLKKTMTKDGNNMISLNNFAISNQNKIISLFDGLIVLNCSAASTTLKNVARKHHNFPFFQEIRIKATTLDKYTETHFFPTFIKLDIEGGEAKAIEGAYNILTKYNPIIAMEILGGESGEKFSSKAVNLLYKLGYKSYAISKDGEIRLMPEINFNQIKNDCENFIFKK